MNVPHFFKQVEQVSTLYGCAMIGGLMLAETIRHLHFIPEERTKLATGEVEETWRFDGGTDGLILAKEIQLKNKFDYEGSCTFGATGSGKSTSLFFPNLLTNNIQGSIIVTDPKSELFKATSKYQEQVCGRKVLKFSPLDPIQSEKYNLLTNCKNSMEVIQLATTLLFNGALSIELATGKKTGSIEWLQMSEPLLASTLLYAKDLEYPYNNIDFAFQLIITLTTEQLEKLLQSSKNVDAIKQFNIFKTVGGADKTEASIKITLASNLKLFTDNYINLVGEDTTFDIESFRKEPTILYVTYPENKSAYLAPFVAPFFSQMMDKLIESYEEKSLPIHLFFDEFGNIGMLNNMSVNVSTIRSRKISMNICLQSVTQLYQIYGRENGKAILNNLKTKMVLPSLSDEDTLNYISNLCGDREITVCNTSVTKSSTTHSYSKTKIKLFEGSEIRRLDDDKILIITSNKQPIIATQNRYYQNKKYTDNVFDCTIKMQKCKIKINDIIGKINDLKLGLAIETEVCDAKSDLFR